MNALIGVRNNASGLLSANKDIRNQVQQTMHGPPQLSAKSAVGRLIAKSSDSSAGAQNDGALQRDAFLQLLATQMRYQDPMDPMDNSDMLSQLAQFSSLEQMNNLNERFSEFAGNLDQLNFLNGTSMLGRHVEGIDNSGQMVSGTVDGVHLDGSVVHLTVGNQVLSMAGIASIRDSEVTMAE